MKNFAKRIAAPHKEQFLYIKLVSIIDVHQLFFCEQYSISQMEALTYNKDIDATKEWECLDE